MFEVGERWRVVIGALGKTDTVGVSAYTEWRELIPPFLFCFPICFMFWWLSLTFDSIGHQGDMRCCHSQHLFLYCQWQNQSLQIIDHANFLLWEHFRCGMNSSKVYFLLRRSILPPLCSERCCYTQHCTDCSEEALLSTTASKHFSSGGRVTGSLWHELFVRGFRDWLVSLCPLKMAYAWVLEWSKVTAMSPSITTRWLTGKMGWVLLRGSNKNTNKEDRETTDYTIDLNLLSFGYCEIIALKRKSL